MLLISISFTASIRFCMVSAGADKINTIDEMMNCLFNKHTPPGFTERYLEYSQ